MAGIGEESGNLEWHARQSADYYKPKSRAPVDNLTTLMEPIESWVVLGVLVAV